MLIRQRYLDKIFTFVDKPIIKVVTGIRRCGKSTLIKQLMSRLTENGVSAEQIIYINRELFAFDFIRDYTDLHKYVSSKVSGKFGRHYIFIDEIQEIVSWEKAVASFLAENKYDIYISGSNARLMSSELATLLAGRYVEFRLYPLSYAEFRELYLQHEDSESNLWSDYLKYGGFPGLHSLNWDEVVISQYLESIYNTVVLKDIMLRYAVRDGNMLNRVLHFISDNCGNITSAKSISDFCKSQQRNISTDTVLNFIQYAKDALLIHQVKRHDLQGKRHLETLEKYYLCDTGLVMATIGNKPTQLSGQLENIVLNELITRGYQVSVGKNKDKEIDFVAERRNERLYVQVCATLVGDGVAAREYGAFEAVSDHFPKWVLSLDNLGWETEKTGIRWKNIKDFLLEE